MEKAFLLQHNYRFFWNPTQGAAITDDGWLRIGSGIKSIDPDNNEEVDQTAYYDDEGGSTSTVTGQQKTYPMDGDRDYNDPFQNFVFDIADTDLTKRNGEFYVINPKKKGLKGNSSLVNIKPPGGDANAKGECSFECHFNGMPEKIDSATEPVVDTAP
ncbi:capsid protein [Listeria booriae]|uniref:Capsid protein n=1 Tax=Listeria booriae TaxID=1552123 RepID=A0A842G9Y2_9LIST|nr:capsid protein [Listeria booriae]MBC2293763.1 capsid protein [Listeria booriae]